MKTSKRIEFPFSSEFLLQQYTNKAFYQARMQEEGIDDVEFADFHEDEKSMGMRMIRHVEVNTDSAPAFIKKIADKFLGDAAQIETKIAWDKNKAKGSNQIIAKGVPIHTSIDISIINQGAEASVMECVVNIKADIPLLGKRLEKFILPKAEKVLVKDFEKAKDYFLTL